MSIKVKDIVVNVLSADRVGQYVEQYDVRILPEMITDKKYAEVMYVDDDGAIITKEFGPYAYPADALRLATEEEKNEYEIERYTVKLNYKDEEITLPIPIAKTIVDAGIHFGKDNTDGSEQIMRYVNDSWNTILRGQDKIKAILLMECYDVYRKRVSAGRSYNYMEYIVNLVFEGRNNDIKADFVEALYANPVKDKDFYVMIERKGHEIPGAYAELIKSESGYVCASMLKGMDLYDYLKDNGRYENYFPHYNQLKVSKKGLDLLMKLDWGKNDTRRILEKLTMTMEDVKHVLINPRRDFSIDVNTWFKSLTWEEIMDNRDMFESSLESEYSIKYRLANGKYVSPEIAGKLFTSYGNVQELVQSDRVKNKSELKLKEMVTFLDNLSDEVTVGHFMSNEVSPDGTAIGDGERVVREAVEVMEAVAIPRFSNPF